MIQVINSGKRELGIKQDCGSLGPGHGYPKGATQQHQNLLKNVEDVSHLIWTASTVITDWLGVLGSSVESLSQQNYFKAKVKCSVHILSGEDRWFEREVK